MIFIDDLLLLASSQEELTRDREGSIHAAGTTGTTGLFNQHRAVCLSALSKDPLPRLPNRLCSNDLEPPRGEAEQDRARLPGSYVSVTDHSPGSGKDDREDDGGNTSDPSCSVTLQGTPVPQERGVSAPPVIRGNDPLERGGRKGPHLVDGDETMERQALDSSPPQT